MKSYKSIIKSAETELIVKHSRFIATAHPVHDADCAESQITDIRNRYKDATHNCFAYIIDEARIRFSDDGEPQGLAGAPILSVIKKRGLEKVLIVVTRYYGGIKLGGGGLVYSYSAAASAVLDKAGLKTFSPSVEAKLRLNYEQVKIAGLIIKQHDADISKIEYKDVVHYSLFIEQEKWQELKSAILKMDIKIEEESCKFR